MAEGKNKVGWFLVRFPIVGGVPKAELTGDHFAADEHGVALAMADEANKTCMVNDAPPVYLVDDGIVMLALTMRRHGGDDDFTQTLLGGLERPDGELADRLDTALRSVTGFPAFSSPWAEEMTDEAVEWVFDELGIKNNNEGEEKDEAH